MWYRDYRCKNWTMFKDYENNIQYGIDGSKNWVKSQPIKFPKANSEYLASEEEVEKSLRKEAKRRGFVEGVRFLVCEGNEELVIDKIKFDTEFKGLHCGNSWIFLYGQWGTVVNEGWYAYLEETNKELEECFNLAEVFYYYKSEKHGANFYELVKEVETKVNDSWKTFVIYKQLGSGLEFSREKEEFCNKFKKVYV